MTLIIELTPEAEERLNWATRRARVTPEDLARSLIEAVPIATEMDSDRTYTARELLKLPATARNRYLRVAAERAAAEYATDLALPEAERELTAFSAVSGADFLDGSAQCRGQGTIRSSSELFVTVNLPQEV
jgi:hypothetical protein